MQDDSNQDNSSVWSSYSDLFTNVAIIFLVMFVFALFKSGVNTIRQVQTEKKHQKELEGKLSESDIQRKEKQVSLINEKINEMKDYENIIDEKVKELNQYAKKIQENKNVLSKVIEDQLKQDSLLKIASENLEREKELKKEKQIELEEAQMRIQLLNEELERITSENIKSQQFQDENFKNTLTATQKRENELKEKLDIEVSNKEKSFNELQEKITQTQLVEKKLRADIREFEKNKTSQDQFISNLAEQFKDLENQLKNNKEVASSLQEEKSKLNNIVGELKKTNQELTRTTSQLKGDLNLKENQSKELHEKLNSLNQQFKNSIHASKKWQNSFEEKEKEVLKLSQKLNESKENFQNLAKTMSALQESVKNDVTNKLISKFKDNKLSAQVNKETGEVILLSGEGFNFQRGSSKLSIEAKKILKEIIPVYASVLFEDSKISSQLSSINMEGHSSPSFGGKFVSPADKDDKAYAFNLRLSALRAASVAEYLMSDEIGDYPHKYLMKSLLQAVGYGYMKPLKSSTIPSPEVSRNIASMDQDCGPWDCKKSQRVQINFLLKDNIDEIRKIIDSNGGIK
jgi:outer membrane protein OmpA-like peptidoglycan-associated protein